MKRIDAGQVIRRGALSVAVAVLLMAPGAAFAAGHNFTTTLRLGAKGTEVTELQKILIDDGYLKAKANGSFGAQTRAAVMAYQKAHGIRVTGELGPLTRAELNKDAPATASETVSNTTTTVTAPPSTAVHPSSSLSADQANAILGLLNSFGADATVIANVKASLGY